MCEQRKIEEYFLLQSASLYGKIVNDQLKIRFRNGHQQSLINKNNTFQYQSVVFLKHANSAKYVRCVI